jgi:hypothetical protein
VVERAYFGDPGSLEITVRLKLADKNVRFLLRYAMVVLLQNQSPTAVQQLQLRVNAAVATWRQQQPPEAPDHELAAIPPRLTHFCDALAALSLDVLVCSTIKRSRFFNLGRCCCFCAGQSSPAFATGRVTGTGSLACAPGALPVAGGTVPQCRSHSTGQRRQSTGFAAEFL